MSFYNRNTCATTSMCGCSGGSRCTGGSTCGAILKTATEERGQMVALNDKLSSYIAKVRNLRSQNHENPAGYHEAIRVLEDEIMKLKGMYEDELARLRALLDAANNDKSGLASKLEQLHLTVNGQQAKNAEEGTRARSLAEELDRANRCLAQAQKEIADLRAALNAKDGKLQQVEPELHRLRRENEELRQKLGAETNLRLKAEECAKAAADQRNFDGKSLNQNMRDLEERLRASNGIIMNLERKICQLSQTETTDIPGLLQKLRDGTSSELRRYQAETEEAFNRGLCALRAQIEEEVRAKGLLGKEKGDLENQNLQLLSQINDLNGQLQTCRDQCKNLEGLLAREQQNAQCNMQNLERRMRELQDGMMSKMKECNNARDAQVALKTEIDAYKVLLEEEERRLSSSANNNSQCLGTSSTVNYVPTPPISRQVPATVTSVRSPRVVTNMSTNSCINLGNTSRSYNPYGTQYNTSYMSSQSNPYITNPLPVKRITADFTPYTAGNPVGGGNYGGVSKRITWATTNRRPASTMGYYY